MLSWQRLRFRSRTAGALFISGFCAYAITAVLASHYEFFSGDLRVARAIQSLDMAWIRPLMTFVSALGSGWLAVALVVFAGVALVAVGRRTEGLVCMAGLGVGRSLTSLLKLLSARPRPSLEFLQVTGSFHELSFPSGHAVFFVEFFGFLFFLTYLLAKRGVARTFALVILATLILLVGVSRVYLGAHWPSDVLGGYLAGMLWLTVMIQTYYYFASPSEPDDGQPKSQQATLFSAK
ncbi:MAG TPA: phosphatase PAP2 family protein [Blastocatellia bacterium]|nr:phosphatase PAP2 family protein [Blastocatellia bacterium]